MERLPRKFTLRELPLTELANEGEEGAVLIPLPDGSCYWVRPKFSAQIGKTPKKSQLRFDAFPLVFGANGVPWSEANLFIFERMSSGYGSSMSSAVGLADDLAAYAKYTEEAQIDWKNFPTHKNSKPTYRYRSYLIHEIWNGKLKPSTAKRRMGSVVRFYRWVIENGLLTPENPPWKETDKLINSHGDYGSIKLLRIKSTDLAIGTTVQDDPFSDCIDDGGKLRPLSPTEQGWVIEALDSLGNSEMLLIHLFALLTGARIQTILTFKLKENFVINLSGDSLLYPVGPGTGIDTKNGKKMSLHIPRWFYELLLTYSQSERRKMRVGRGGNVQASEYLFLSVRGQPMYVARQDETKISAYGERYRKNGQAVRQYMTDYVIPYVRTKYEPKFSYQFHDLRASYGMNLVDRFLPELAIGSKTYMSVLSFIQARLCHSSPTTTERYLNFRGNRQMAQAIQSDWEAHLESIAHRAMERRDAEI